jgi:putative transposase
MGLVDSLMKIVVKVKDVVALAKRFELAPREAMQEVVAQVREGVRSTLEDVMAAEIELFLGQDAEKTNKRNGFSTRTFAIKGVGAIELRVPRDREGRFRSNVVPPQRHYDQALEQDLALLHVAGLSTRTLANISERVLGVNVSHTEVGQALRTLVPAAKAFLERPLGERKYKYLYVDGTFFRVRRTTVEAEPTLVVLGVDEEDRRSILAMIQGDKDDPRAWRMVFDRLKGRGLDGSAVQFGIMDGLPGLATAFSEAFPKARTARCWVHKARNVMPRATGREGATQAFTALKERWTKTCEDAVECLERDLEALLVHYDFPKDHWDALRTTNPIERVNKEFKRRSKAMETIGPDGLKVLLAFTALRLEYGWATTPITSKRLKHLGSRAAWEAKQLESLGKGMLQLVSQEGRPRHKLLATTEERRPAGYRRVAGAAPGRANVGGDRERGASGRQRTSAGAGRGA